MLKPAEKKLTGKQKAAIVLVALGTEIASKILPHLNEAEVEELSLEIARLGSIPAEVRQQVIKEFYEICLAQNLALEGGLDHARTMLEQAFGPDKAQEILERLTRALQMLPFDSIKGVHPTQLSTFLADEHPQTIALVLAYLEPQTAAAVISNLPPELRPEVAERLATMGSTPPDVIRRVEAVLQRKLSSIASQELSAAGGVKSLVEVLQWVDRNTERAIFDYLNDTNPELAEEIRKLMFTFEDLLQLDDRAIQQVLKEVDMKELALALKGASDALKEKIFRNMSERAVNMLKEEIEFMGPVRVRQVEEAQQRIVSIVRRLEEAGEIVISRGGEEEMLI
ncbi:MAG: flagellar motor switch protein FliG [Fimbriimonadales bacterium]|jgi:flagellar motor switch protein FliG|nr:flagellar motor switch protein FliG [Armatimonadota bacterium]MCX7688219.1 flagellar motor switch protein FliG [Fimbriimonadales bacterium]GIV13893.1 MAG: flagellar motor switch protein FliG [Fimbriimonadales bacterium]CUU36946.1 flagellar motor switch protein FliG [Armatimonadetes bacterium DC]